MRVCVKERKTERARERASKREREQKRGRDREGERERANEREQAREGEQAREREQACVCVCERERERERKREKVKEKESKRERDVAGDHVPRGCGSGHRTGTGTGRGNRGARALKCTRQVSESRSISGGAIGSLTDWLTCAQRQGSRTRSPAERAGAIWRFTNLNPGFRGVNAAREEGRDVSG
jgi:hypothetical protein